MSYKALYRKYRSTTFDEIVGQRPIIKTLQNALNANKISHAYLFSGPRGTGKTSVARLFAKALNCEEGIGHICNKCDSCTSINSGSHPDIIEIDAASNSGVDEVRDLIDKVKYAPIKGRYKVYIIDEVHMMTNNAFNALLKTLEEPPSYVVFILCTTEPYKLLPTIVSRCQRYDFKKIEDNDLSYLIQEVLSKEHIEADDEAINILVELANGGARDALSILDQVIAYSSTYIKASDIEQIFGLCSLVEKINFLKFIRQGDTLLVLNKLKSFINKNVDILRLTSELLDLLKDVLIYRKTNAFDLVNTPNKNMVKELSVIFTDNQLNSMIFLLMDCQKEFKITSNPNFTFEVYILKLLNLFKSNEFSDEKVVETLPKKEEPTPIVDKKHVENVVVNKPIVQEIKKEETPVSEPVEVKIEHPTPTKETKVTKKDIDIFNPLDEVEEPKKEISKTPNFYHDPAKPKDNSKLSRNGLSYYIDDDNLIKILVTANKDERTNLANIFKDKLEEYIDDQTFNEAAQLLIDTSIFALTKNEILVVSNFDNDAKKINVKDNQNLFSTLLRNISKKKLFVYALSRSRYIDIRRLYLSLSQVNKLPKIDDIKKIDIQEEEID